MRRVYCGKIGTEYRYISSPTEKYWIRERIAAAADAGPLPTDVRTEPARQAHRGRGVRALPRHEVPRASGATPSRASTRRSRCSTGWSRARPRRGVDEIVIGMSHRGRLNILANVVGNSAERIFSGFEGVVHPDFPADEGDVKYHQGARTTRALRVGPRRRDPGRVQPVAPRGRRSGRRGRRARQAGAAGGARARGLEARAAGAAPRRRGVRGPGHGRRGPEPRAAAGLPHGRHDPRRRQQPDRLHDAALEGPLVGLFDRRREDQPGPDLPRQRRRSRGRVPRARDRARLPRRSSTRTSSST